MYPYQAMRARTFSLRYQSSFSESSQDKQQRERQQRQKYRNWLVAGVGGGALVGALSATRTAVLREREQQQQSLSASASASRWPRTYAKRSPLTPTPSGSGSGSDSGPGLGGSESKKHPGLAGRNPPHKTRSATALAASLSLGHSATGVGTSSSSEMYHSPVSRDELGQATWTLLHTVGAQFPERPTRQQRRAVTQLVQSLQHVYPCHSCAQHWQSVLKEFGPPKVRSGTELRTWLCEMHNVVNQSVGKRKFDCSWQLEERWGTSASATRVGGKGKGAEKSFRSPLCGDGSGSEGDVCTIPGRK